MAFLGLHGKVGDFILTWNARADLGFSLSQRWVTGLAWRWNKVDYDKGEGADRQLFDMTYNGPLVFVGCT